MKFIMIYIAIVVLFWLYLISLKIRNRISTVIMFAWMVSGASIIGLVLFFIFKKKYKSCDAGE